MARKPFKNFISVLSQGQEQRTSRVRNSMLISCCCPFEGGPVDYPEGGAGLRAASIPPARGLLVGPLVHPLHKLHRLVVVRNVKTVKEQKFHSSFRYLIGKWNQDGFFRCCGSMTFRGGSGSGDPSLWLMDLVDPDSDPDPQHCFFLHSLPHKKKVDNAIHRYVYNTVNTDFSYYFDFSIWHFSGFLLTNRR